MSTTQPRLYHGTSARHLAAILERGLVPRSELKSKGNWAHTVPSNPHSIYLTDAYPLHFAYAASSVKREEQGLIVEVNTASLAADAWRPDEDFLEQGTRGRDQLPADWDMKRRNRHYREHAHEFEAAPSLKYLGTIAYAGAIPPAAITRLALIDNAKMRELIRWGFDPQIVVANYRFLGDFYRRGTQWLFGASPECEQGMHGPREWPERDGITIVTPDELRQRAAASA